MTPFTELLSEAISGFSESSSGWILPLCPTGVPSTAILGPESASLCFPPACLLTGAPGMSEQVSWELLGGHEWAGGQPGRATLCTGPSSSACCGPEPPKSSAQTPTRSLALKEDHAGSGPILLRKASPNLALTRCAVRWVEPSRQPLGLQHLQNLCMSWGPGRGVGPAPGPPTSFLVFSQGEG